MIEAYSIGIIGGADGPTAIFVAGSFPWELITVLGILIALTFWYFKRNK